MKTFLRTLIVLLVTVMSFAAAEAYECQTLEDPLTGLVCKIQHATDTDPSTIWIDPEGKCSSGDEANWLEIIGFPFGNLELQLNDLWPNADEEITIDEGDCVKIEYVVKNTTWDEYYKWCSLLVFYDDLGNASCDTCPTSAQYCYESYDSDNNPPIVRKPHRAGNNKGKPPWN